jgi:hypothetical protein
LADPKSEARNPKYETKLTDQNSNDPNEKAHWPSCVFVIGEKDLGFPPKRENLSVT